MTTTKLKGVALTDCSPPPLKTASVEGSLGSMGRWSPDSRGTRSPSPRDFSAAGGSERLKQNGLKPSYMKFTSSRCPGVTLHRLRVAFLAHCFASAYFLEKNRRTQKHILSLPLISRLFLYGIKINWGKILKPGDFLFKDLPVQMPVAGYSFSVKKMN